jgi:hypothetical protein
MPQERLVQATLSPLTPGGAFSAVTVENKQKQMENRQKISRGLTQTPSGGEVGWHLIPLLLAVTSFLLRVPASAA